MIDYLGNSKIFQNKLQIGDSISRQCMLLFILDHIIFRNRLNLLFLFYTWCKHQSYHLRQRWSPSRGTSHVKWRGLNSREWPKPGIVAICNMNTPNHSPPPKTSKIGSDFGPHRKRTSRDLFLSLMDSKTFSIQNSCSATFFHKQRSLRIRAISFIVRIFPFRCQHARFRQRKLVGVLKHSKMESSGKNTLKLWCGSKRSHNNFWKPH